MKGIILAAGLGTRLYPITSCISKQLLPIYNKPMIYYPLSILMLGGIKDILIITNPHDADSFKKLLGDGSSLGLKIQYDIQKEPRGIADALIIGESFIQSDSVCLLLGDNIFYGHEMPELLKNVVNNVETGKSSAVVFGYPVKNPRRYGVAVCDKSGYVLDIQEKPDNPKSDCAVTGLYMYDNTCVRRSKELELSGRGELEITDLNKLYLEEKILNIEMLGRGHAWFDTGTFESFYEASNFVRSVENRQGLMISNVHEIAFRCGYITRDELLSFVEKCGENTYKEYLIKVLSKSDKDG